MSNNPSGLSKPIEVIAKAVHDLVGIQLGVKQHAMIESRLTRRLQELQLASLQDYLEYFYKHEESETQNLVSLLTTHHTYFFREFSHFEYMLEKGLAPVIEAARKRPDKTVRIWSAACSRGQEVYSLAMFLDHHLKFLAPDLKYEIYGTDVDPKSVKIAQNGVYHRDEIKEVPLTMLSNHWARGTGDISDFVKVRGSLKDHCKFDALNLLNFKATAPKWDFIFCRNVFIYFDQNQIQSISKQLMQSLTPEGCFFIGVSESLMGLDLPVANSGPSVYRHKSTVVTPVPAKPGVVAPAAAKAAPAPAPAPTLLRVLCVDDSPSILALMKQMLKKEDGFEIVGTASNGIEAASARAKLKPDAMTLDLHMPVQGGLEYLKANYDKSHPPVIIVSSVSRDEQTLALEALKLGASDYVEKPQLADMKKRGEEIRGKIKVAVQSKALGRTKDLKVEEEFSRAEAKASTGGLRILMAHVEDRERVATTLKEMRHQGARTVVLWMAEDGKMVDFRDATRKLAADCGADVDWCEDIEATKKKTPSCFFAADGKRLVDSLRGDSSVKAVSCSVFGPKMTDAKYLQKWKNVQVLLEDREGVDAKKWTFAVGFKVEVVPATSFAYMSNLHCGKKAA